MSEWRQVLLTLLVGIVLGTAYFGGLWLTVRRLPTARHPALLSLGSFFIRTLVTMLGFYLVMGSQWERLLLCLGGFLLARTVLMHRWGPAPARPESLET